MKTLLAERAPLSVSEAANLVRSAIDAVPVLRSVAVRGEITEYKSYPKFSYFGLKDENAILNCVVFSTSLTRMPELRNGLSVVATGKIAAYPKRSTYQLQVQDVVPDGLGELHLRFEQLKRRLEAEGLFESSRKRALPSFPFRVALVSSRSAAGASDFMTYVARHIEIVWCETSVQGIGAPPEIVRALDHASSLDVDLIVVTRGGGSFEDLFCFSDESVVRALASCRHPVVSAVGHAIDRQLSDLAADRYFETPTAAAQGISPTTEELRAVFDQRHDRMDGSLSTLLARKRNQMQAAIRRSLLERSDALIGERRQTLVEWRDRLETVLRERLSRRRERLRAWFLRLSSCSPAARLARTTERLVNLRLTCERKGHEMLPLRRARVEAACVRLAEVTTRALLVRHSRLNVVSAQLAGLDPTAILQRGYAIVESKGRIVRDASSVACGARIDVRLARGALHARVEEREDHDNRTG
ncbi:MAG TPA: exodeoxyribonuclease VII large subunit [Candidatus Baltobacteraceae bacterium]|jgi:exodeoxyribonuclease VII large subunit|nr:exodeoxyribonuclease VII large subunit [Candidatus Baltobacteraceae bacterium]